MFVFYRIWLNAVVHTPVPLAAGWPCDDCSFCWVTSTFRLRRYGTSVMMATCHWP